MTIRMQIYAVIAALVVAVAGFVVWKLYAAGRAAEAASVAAEQATALRIAADVARRTEEARAAEQTETATRGQTYETIIRDRIVRVPAPADPADPDILRAVSAAHAAALCAASRVQRAQCGAAPTAAADGD